MWLKDARPNKDKIRGDISNYLKKSTKVVNAALCLPGVDCEDIKQFVSNGVFNPSVTVLYIVEKNQKFHKSIKQILKKLGFKHIYFHGDELYKLKLDRYFDFVSIDLMGVLSAEIAFWLHSELLNHIDHHTILTFTVSENAKRGNSKNGKSFMDKCHYCFTQEYEELIDDMINRAITSPTTPQVTPLILIETLLMFWTIDAPQIVRYSDIKTPMINYIFALKKRNRIISCGKIMDVFSMHKLQNPSKRILSRKMT